MDKIVMYYSKDISFVKDVEIFIKTVVVPEFNQDPSKYPKELRYELEKYNFIKRQSLKDILKDLKKNSCSTEEIQRRNKETLAKDLIKLEGKKLDTI